MYSKWQVLLFGVSFYASYDEITVFGIHVGVLYEGDNESIDGREL